MDKTLVDTIFLIRSMQKKLWSYGDCSEDAEIKIIEDALLEFNKRIS